MSRRRSALTAASLAAVAAVGTGVALAAGATLPFSGDGNTINGCYTPGGDLRLLTPTTPSCPGGAAPIQWNATGPAGPAGPQGPTGPQGPQGPPGPTGLSDIYFGRGHHTIPDGQTDTVAYVTLPPGTYLLWGTVEEVPYSGDNLDIGGGCSFTTDNGTATVQQQSDGLYTSSFNTHGLATVPLVGTATATTTVDIRIDCITSGAADYWGSLLAVPAGTVHVQDH